MSEEKRDISNEDIYKLLQILQNQNIEMNGKLGRIEEINSKLERIEEHLSKEVGELKQKTHTLEEENAKLKKQLLAVQKQNKKYNVLIHGVPETQINIEQAVEHIFSENLGIFLSNNFRDIYRIGKKVPNKTRPILIELQTYKYKCDILKNRNKLKGTNTYITSDSTQEELEEQKILNYYYKLAKRQQYPAKILKNKLIVNGTIYSVEELKLNPVEFCTSSLTTNKKQDSVSPTSPNLIVEIPQLNETNLYLSREKEKAYEKNIDYEEIATSSKIRLNTENIQGNKQIAGHKEEKGKVTNKEDGTIAERLVKKKKK